MWKWRPRCQLVDSRDTRPLPPWQTSHPAPPAPLPSYILTSLLLSLPSDSKQRKMGEQWLPHRLPSPSRAKSGRGCLDKIPSGGRGSRPVGLRPAASEMRLLAPRPPPPTPHLQGSSPSTLPHLGGSLSQRELLLSSVPSCQSSTRSTRRAKRAATVPRLTEPNRGQWWVLVHLLELRSYEDLNSDADCTR